MASYYEVKQRLCRLLGSCFQVEVNDESGDAPIYLHPKYLPWSENEKNETITIDNNKLRKLYDIICQSQSENLALFTETMYEVAINANTIMLLRSSFPASSDDQINDIAYELSKPSLKYCIYLVMKIVDAEKERKHIIIRPPFNSASAYRMQNKPWQDILQRTLCEVSLKITRRTGKTDFSLFQEYKTSYLFDFMYRSGIALGEYSDINDMFPSRRIGRGSFNIAQIDTPPLRKYSGDLVGYYRLALSSDDVFVQYISFYHIMEYFYDEVFRKRLIRELQLKITKPDFSYKNEDKIYDIAEFVRKRYQMNREAGQGNELESFKFVLEEYIPTDDELDDLKKRIESISSGSVQYYEKTKVPFCAAPVIPWSDKNGIYTHIAKRIYQTRNSLVHSKSGKNQTRYLPYQNEKELRKEIPLVQAVAESIIIHSSSIM